MYWSADCLVDTCLLRAVSSCIKDGFQVILAGRLVPEGKMLLEVYWLQDAIVTNNFLSLSIFRVEDERNITDEYATVTAATKKKHTSQITAPVELVDNDLYSC
mgnify:CR=1 FL=1